MIAITITLHIDAAAAVRAGSCAAGPQRVSITQSDLDAMTPGQRRTLAEHLDERRADAPTDRVRWGDPLTLHAPRVGVADIATVRDLLDQRALAMVQQAARDMLDQSPLAVQRRIVEAVRAADDGEARRIARCIVDGGPDRDAALVLAASRDPAIRDAMAQIYQCDKLDGRPVIARDLRTNPNQAK